MRVREGVDGLEEKVINRHGPSTHLRATHPGEELETETRRCKQLLEVVVENQREALAFALLHHGQLRAQPAELVGLVPQREIQLLQLLR